MNKWSSFALPKEGGTFAEKVGSRAGEPGQDGDEIALERLTLCHSALRLVPVGLISQRRL